MILRPAGNEMVAVRQDDHAALAAWLLEHWIDRTFRNEPRRESILRAARLHDNGWKDLDDAPTRDSATGLPVNFTDVTPEQALDIWRRGTDALMDDPFVELLVVHHAYSIYETAYKRVAEWKAFFTEFAQRRARLRSRLGVDHPELEHAYSFLRMADQLSLAWCMKPEPWDERPVQYAGYRFRREGEGWLFTPWPFDTRELRYDLPVARLRAEGYRTRPLLARALATTETETILLTPMALHRR